MSEWCEHIKQKTVHYNVPQYPEGKQQADFWFDEKGCFIVGLPKFCPICGAKRPEEKKKLWVRLSDLEGSKDKEWNCMILTEEAKKAFRELIDNHRGTWKELKEKVEDM